MSYERVRVDPLHARERTASNVGRSAARRRVIQAKLRVGPADDALEREADAVAAKVLRRLAAPVVPAAADTVPTEDSADARVQRAAVATPAAAPGHGLAGGQAEPDVARRVERSAGGGRALEADVQDRMQRAFGADFSGVRVHDDPAADELSRSLNARAFTAGSDIYFGAGQYRPSSPTGQELLAHELTHTLQQGSPRVRRSTAPASEVSTDHSRAVRRWDVKSGIDISTATKIRTVDTGQAVFMLKDGSGDEVVVKAENYPLGLMKLATLVHESVHQVEIIDASPLDAGQKQALIDKIGDPTVTSDPSWDAAGSGALQAYKQQGDSNAAAARRGHQQQIATLALQVQKFAKGVDAKKQAKDKSPGTGLRSMLQSPKYMRQIGAAAAADMFTGNADRAGGVTNLGNWVADAAERVQLIDNMDANARVSFGKGGDNLFPYDMIDWGKNPETFYAGAIDGLLAGAEREGDATIVQWANADGGFVRRFMIDDYRWGFEETVQRIVKLYGTDKGGKAGRATKKQVKGLDSAGHLDFWEVLKARARYMQNPANGKKLRTTVLKRQADLDKKTTKKAGKK